MAVLRSPSTHSRMSTGIRSTNPDDQLRGSTFRCRQMHPASNENGRIHRLLSVGNLLRHKGDLQSDQRVRDLACERNATLFPKCPSWPQSLYGVRERARGWLHKG